MTQGLFVCVVFWSAVLLRGRSLFRVGHFRERQSAQRRWRWWRWCSTQWYRLLSYVLSPSLLFGFCFVFILDFYVIHPVLWWAFQCTAIFAYLILSVTVEMRQFTLWFLRRRILFRAELATTFPSVRPSVRLWNAWIVTKRNKLLPKFYTV